MINITELSEIILRLNPNSLYSVEELEQITTSRDIIERIRQDKILGRFFSDTSIYGAFILNALYRIKGSHKKPLRNIFANAEQLAEIAQIPLARTLSKYFGEKPLVSEISIGNNGSRTTFLGVPVSRIHYLFAECPKSKLAESVIKYKQTQSRDDFNEACKKGEKFVRYFAERTAAKLPKSVDADELICAGYDGFREAVEAFQPDREVKFETYASNRIRGAILDYIRENDLLSRQTREKITKITKATEKYLALHNQPPTITELSHLTGMSSEQIEEEMRIVKSTSIRHLDFKVKSDDSDNTIPYSSHIAQSREPNPLEAAIQNEKRQVFWTEINRIFSVKERKILVMYLLEERTMMEIGKEINLTESRVCQLIGIIMSRLRNPSFAAKMGYDSIFTGSAQPIYVNGQEVIML